MKTKIILLAFVALFTISTSYSAEACVVQAVDATVRGHVVGNLIHLNYEVAGMMRNIVVGSIQGGEKVYDVTGRYIGDVKRNRELWMRGDTAAFGSVGGWGGNLVFNRSGDIVGSVNGGCSQQQVGAAGLLILLKSFQPQPGSCLVQYRNAAIAGYVEPSGVVKNRFGDTVGSSQGNGLIMSEMAEILGSVQNQREIFDVQALIGSVQAQNVIWNRTEIVGSTSPQCPVRYAAAAGRLLLIRN